ncbi:MAG: hypothetical protein ACT4OF_04440, partial [Caulobacteraceae bacterium]
MRVLWVLLMLCGVVVFGSLSVFMFYGFYLDREALIAEGRVRGLVEHVLFITAAGFAHDQERFLALFACCAQQAAHGAGAVGDGA